LGFSHDLAVGSFDLRERTRLEAMNRSVAARRQTAALWIGGTSAALCRDAATTEQFMGSFHLRKRTRIGDRNLPSPVLRTPSPHPMGRGMG